MPEVSTSGHGRELANGTSVGMYRITGQLGKGGMAVVYRAVHAALGREVALKVVSPQFAEDPTFRSRFLREAQVAARINHPNVVTCFDAGEGDGRLFMALELVTGGDLLDLLDRRGGRLDEVLALGLMRDALAGLEAVEAAGLVHRDIKPANIFITDGGQAKVADLGLARVSGNDQVTQPGVIMGTPAYIAPEQANGVPDLDIRADLYSLGASLYHLLTGQPPFSSDSAVATLIKALNEPVPDPAILRPDLTPGCRTLILRLMEKDRNRRHVSARQAREEVETLLTGRQPELASGGHPGVRTQRLAAAPVRDPALVRAVEQRDAGQVEPNAERQRTTAAPAQPTTERRRSETSLAPSRPDSGSNRPASASDRQRTQAGERPATPTPAAPGPGTDRQGPAPDRQGSAADRHGSASDRQRVQTGDRSRSSPAVTAKSGGPATPAPRPATPAPPGSGQPPANLRIDPTQLALLVKRIIVDFEAMTAAIVLAPGASFPRFLLDQIISGAGIVHGLIPGAIHETTRTSQVARRIVLARGDPPSPGFPGRNVRGEDIPALEVPLTIRISDDAMTAWAFSKPNLIVTREALEPILKRSGIRYGLDLDALRKLVDGPPAPDGRRAIARGRPMDPGRAAGFVPPGREGGTPDLATVANLQEVPAGTVLGTFTDAEPGIPGMDVLGRELPCPKLEAIPPEQLAGEGTEIGRDRDGRLVLRSTRQGMVVRNPDGVVRVVGVFEVKGDFGPGDPPIETNDVVVIRGAVKDGAKISSASDVFVCGDLHDAEISAGGSLQVEGAIHGGDQALVVGETIVAESCEVRRVLASSVRITGEVRNCEIRATGKISVGSIAGGSLVAGGDVDIGTAGDLAGTTTELWAGHSLSYSEQERLSRLDDQRREAERTRLVDEAKLLHADLADAELKKKRHASASYANRDHLQAIEAKLRQFESAQENLRNAAEEHRKALEKRRAASDRLRKLGDNTEARVSVKVVAHKGVVARLADIEPEVLGESRLRYTLKM